MSRFIITIGRQFGSGGREIGRLVAQELGIPYFDRELIELAAQQGGFNKDAAAAVDEKPTNSLLYALATGSAMMGTLRYAPHTELPLNDKLFISSTKVIKELASKGSCVIIGRCADYILREDKDLIRVFIHAQREKRIERAVDLYGIAKDKAEATLTRMDKQRSSYYSYYTGHTWSAMENYDLCMDAGSLTTQAAARVIVAFAKERQG